MDPSQRFVRGGFFHRQEDAQNRGIHAYDNTSPSVQRMEEDAATQS